MSGPVRRRITAPSYFDPAIAGAVEQHNELLRENKGAGTNAGAERFVFSRLHRAAALTRPFNLGSASGDSREFEIRSSNAFNEASSCQPKPPQMTGDPKTDEELRKKYQEQMKEYDKVLVLATRMLEHNLENYDAPERQITLQSFGGGGPSVEKFNERLDEEARRTTAGAQAAAEPQAASAAAQAPAEPPAAAAAGAQAAPVEPQAASAAAQAAAEPPAAAPVAQAAAEPQAASAAATRIYYE